MKDLEILERVDNAVSALVTEPRPLQVGASERSFAHRLAVHMEVLFSGWDIDCEYNRQGLFTKELSGIRQCDDQRKTDKIFPDIIVHHRMVEDKNLLVVEMKHNSPEDLCDKTKLELLTNSQGQYGYQLGLYINITNRGRFEMTWYKNGVIISVENLLS